MTEQNASGTHTNGSTSARKSSKPPVKMLFDRLLVAPEVDAAERHSAEGLVIPATAKGPRRLAWAEVVAKGQGVRQVNEGDRVLYDPEEKPEVDISGANYVLLKEHDVHGVSQQTDDTGTGLYL